MAHFAQLDENNIVTQVIVVSNEDIKDMNGIESEEIGIGFCKKVLGSNTNWKQTSYNGNFRVRYAGIGFSYNEELDAFVPPKPYDSWILDEETVEWKAPIPYPDDTTGAEYAWNEDIQSWVEWIVN